MLPVSALNTIVHYYVAPKKVVEKFSFHELKIEWKSNFFYSEPYQNFLH